MSDTPRVDEAAERVSDLGPANAVLSGLWRLALKLERELAAVTQERDALRAHLITAVRWIEGHNDEIGLLDTTDGYYKWSNDPRRQVLNEACKAAIDAAMKGEG